LTLILLCFIYLTLPNFAGKLLKALSKDGKQATKCNKAKNRQDNKFARPQFALNSPWRVSKEKISREACLPATSSHSTRHGELTKEKIGRSSCLLAMASEVTWEASKGG